MLGDKVIQNVPMFAVGRSAVDLGYQKGGAPHMLVWSIFRVDDALPRSASSGRVTVTSV